MTEQEILEGNKLIAEFCNYNINNDGCYLIGCRESFIIGRNYSEWCSTTSIKYDFTKQDDCNKAINVGEFYYNISPNNLLYHSSWDWLMPVIDKIDSMNCPYEDYTWKYDNKTYHNFMGFNVDIKPKHCVIWEDLELDPPNIIGGGYDKLYNSRIEAAWNAVIEFIKWYNLCQKEK